MLKIAKNFDIIDNINNKRSTPKKKKKTFVWLIISRIPHAHAYLNYDLGTTNWPA